MNVEEARSFLDLARMIDNRIGEVDDAKAAIWADLLADVELAAAIAALKEHYRASIETIMPAHIRPTMKRLMAGWQAKQRRARDELRWASQRRAIESGTSVATRTRDPDKVPADVDPHRSPAKQAAWQEMRQILGPRKPRPRKWWERAKEARAGGPASLETPVFTPGAAHLPRRGPSSPYVPTDSTNRPERTVHGE